MLFKAFVNQFHIVFTELSEAHPKFDAVLGVLVLDDGPHLEPLLESARHVVGRLARLHRALDARPHALLAQHAQQRPTRLLRGQKRGTSLKID